MRYLVALALFIACTSALGQGCYRTSVMAPSPLMGNHGEIFRTSEGAIFEVVGSYEYLYAYYPEVTICPGHGRMLVEGKAVGIRPLKTAATPQNRIPSADAPITVALRVSGCDYFIADGPNGYYILEWYGGYDPNKGDGIFGEIRGYGFKNVIYANGREGRLYVDDYALGRDSALNKLRDHCK